MYNTFEECRSHFSNRYQYLDISKTCDLSRSQCEKLFNEAIQEYLQEIVHNLLDKNSDLYNNSKRLSELDNLLEDVSLKAITNLKDRATFPTTNLMPELYSYISFRAIGTDGCGAPLSTGCKLLESELFDKLMNNSIYVKSSAKEPYICIRNNAVELISLNNNITTLNVTILKKPSLFVAHPTDKNLDQITNIKNIKVILDIAFSNATLATFDRRWQAIQSKQKTNPN